MVYGVEGQPLTITWDLDLENGAFYNGAWSIGESRDDIDLNVIVSVSQIIEILVNPAIAESTTFGEVTIKSLDSGHMKVIKAEASDVTLAKALDFVTIKYLGKSMQQKHLLNLSLTQHISLVIV